MGLVNRGGYGEYVIMHKSFVMDMPSNLTFEEAAAIPEVFNSLSNIILAC